MRDAKADNRTQIRPLTARTLAVVAALGLLFGLIGAGEAPEDSLRVARNGLTATDASGQIVLIAIDDKAQREVGNWPFRPSLSIASMQPSRIKSCSISRTTLGPSLPTTRDWPKHCDGPARL